METMTRRTLGSVKGELTRLAGNAGMAVTDARFLARVNEATEELMNAGDWPGVVDVWLMRMSGGMVILPRHLERIMGVCVNGKARQMRSGWYEFMQYGPGTMGVGNDWSNVVVERGETCFQVELRDGGGPWRLRVEGQVDERDDGGNRPVVNFQGEDVNGRVIRTQVGGKWILGENVEINGDMPSFSAESVSIFGKVTALVKPETRGVVRVFCVEEESGMEILAGEYEAGETAPAYRRYLVPGAEGDEVVARCRRRFEPVRDDNDVLIISNIRALKAMIMAVEKHDSGNVENLQMYNAYRANAVGLMRTEAQSYKGKSRTPVIDFQRGVTMGGDMPYVR